MTKERPINTPPTAIFRNGVTLKNRLANGYIYASKTGTIIRIINGLMVFIWSGSIVKAPTLPSIRRACSTQVLP